MENFDDLTIENDQFKIKVELDDGDFWNPRCWMVFLEIKYLNHLTLLGSFEDETDVAKCVDVFRKLIQENKK